MRPIYRIWNNNSKEYMIDCLEGIIYFVKQDGELCSIDEDSFIGLPSGQDYIIERCTGLKDMNNVWIYEGNLFLEYSIGKPYSRIRQVIFETGHFQIIHWDHIDKQWLDSRDGIWNIYNRIKVIGNIHENPELLKEIEDD